MRRTVQNKLSSLKKNNNTQEEEEVESTSCEYNSVKSSYNSYCTVFKNELKEYKKCFNNFCLDCCLKKFKLEIPIKEGENLITNTTSLIDLIEYKLSTSESNKQKIRLCMAQCNEKEESNSDKNDKILSNNPSLILKTEKNISKVNRKSEESKFETKSNLNKVKKAKFDTEIEYEYNANSNEIVNNKLANEVNSKETCDKIILNSFSTLGIGRVIRVECLSNFKSLNFQSKNQCLSSLCKECCNNLDSVKAIQSCQETCNIESSDSLSSKIEKDEILDYNLNLKQNEYENEIQMENNKLFQEQIVPKNESKNEIELLKEEIKKLKTEKLKSKNLSNNNEIVAFLSIKSICEEEYFSNCFDLLCSDYCSNYGDECLKNCNNVINLSPPFEVKDTDLSEKISLIIKRHNYFYSKYKLNPEILSGRKGLGVGVERELSDFSINQNIISSNPNNKLSKYFKEKSNIKEKIKNLKNQLLDEEKKLLDVINKETSNNNQSIIGEKK